MALFCFLRSAAVDFLVCLKTDSMLLSPQQCKAFVLLGRLNSRIWVGFLVFLEDHLFPSHKPVGQGTCSRNFCQTFLWVPSESYEEETTSGCSLPLREIHFPQGFQTFSLSFTNSLTILAKLFNAQQHPFWVSKSSQFISPCRWLCSNFGLVGGPVTSTLCDFKNSFRCVVCFCKKIFVSVGLMLFLTFSISYELVSLLLLPTFVLPELPSSFLHLATSYLSQWSRVLVCSEDKGVHRDETIKWLHGFTGKNYILPSDDVAFEPHLDPQEILCWIWALLFFFVK